MGNLTKLKKTNAQEEQWAAEEELEKKAHFLCLKNGFTRPLPMAYTTADEFFKDEKVYNERYEYYYSQLAIGKIQII